MISHPANHLERLKIKKKKDAQKQKGEDYKASRLWRAEKGRDKEKELEDELRSAHSFVQNEPESGS